MKKFLWWRFLKHLYFSINFTNFLKHVCVDQFVLKFGISIRKKISDQYHGKIPDQEFKSWSIKYLKLKIKNKIWCIHNFFEPVSNNASSSNSASSSSISQVTVIGYFDILIFFDIFFNNCPHFSQRRFFNLNFQVAHMCSFHQIFFLYWSQKVIPLTKSLLKIN